MTVVGCVSLIGLVFVADGGDSIYFPALTRFFRVTQGQLVKFICDKMQLLLLVGQMPLANCTRNEL